MANKSGYATEDTLDDLLLAYNASDAVPTALGDNRKVVASAGTAEALATSITVKEVLVTAETNNTGIIAVGGSTVVAAEATRRGTPLYPGDSVTVKIDDLASIYIDSTVNGDGVTYAYEV